VPDTEVTLGPEPAKRKGRPPKAQSGDSGDDPSTKPAKRATGGLIDLLPHLVGLQEAHIKPLTKVYHILSELHPSDRRRVAGILARVFA
jgi:hypothetical protein